MNPVTNIAAIPIEFGAHAIDNIRDLTRNELFYVLVGAIVIGTVGNGRT